MSHLVLGIGEWDRMVEKVKWPGGGDDVINLDDQSDDDISSYSDNSSLSSCNSPEIGRREITDIETVSEISDEFGDHRTKEMSPCFSGSLLEREAGRRVGVAKGGLIEDSWRKRKTRLSKGEKHHWIQTSTPLLQVCVCVCMCVCVGGGGGGGGGGGREEGEGERKGGRTKG